MTLLRAVADLPEGIREWRLLIAGDGRELSALREFAAGRPSLARRVVFLGEIRNIPEFLNALDVYALPSISEGISNSLLEAMATGLPAIASAVGGNPEVVEDGESGLLFPVGDADSLRVRLLTLFEQPDLRARLGQSAVERVRREFSATAMIQNYERLY